MNAIISASRRDMLGADMYMVGKNYIDKTIVHDANSCSICKRLIINAGIKNLYIRDSKDTHRLIDVDDWISNDDSLIEDMNLGY